MENEFIAWLRERLPPHPCLRLGPGDDAAVVDLAGQSAVVVTVDMLMDGVDFRLAEIDPSRAGHKALGVNLSDLAAMAAEPVAAVVALALPRQGGRRLAEALFAGMLPLAEQFNLAIAGGDTNSWDGPLAISITAIGKLTARGPLRRSGGRAGDWLLVTGTLGGSILGRHLDVEPRVREALTLHERYELHAGIDISDGLALDLSRLCNECKCGAVLRSENIPISSAARTLSANDPAKALEHALSDGEDFELLLAAAPVQVKRMLADGPLGVPLTCIGELTAEPGLYLEMADGSTRRLSPSGYQHAFDP